MNEPIEDLYQDLVLEHKRAPRRYGPVAGATQRAQGTNPQCGDSVDVEVRIEGDTLKDIGFTGHGCAICIASSSMMSEALYGKELAVARDLHTRFRGVLTGEIEPQEANLGKLQSLAGVRRYPSRIKCALLGWHALMHAIAQTDADGKEK
ncbi:MAG: SUF system NifU family Fe-S cluster assembly protein [Brachymonas sp.]|nr:SUF system NifU family Fe-S cluster assembly protein [Brachymonas sp.]